MQSLGFKTLGLLLMLAYSLVVLFGLGLTAHIDSTGMMSDCPFSAGGSLCPMNLFQHIAMFNSSFLAYVLYPVVLVCLLLVYTYLSLGKQPLHASFVRRLYSTKYSPPISTIFSFLISLSDGILQPKLYA